MKKYFGSLLLFILCSISTTALAQSLSGRIVDSITREGISGVSIRCHDENCGVACTSNSFGEFQIQCKGCSRLVLTSIGYTQKFIDTTDRLQVIYLQPSTSIMNAVVVSASRGDKSKRSDAPVAISTLTSKMIQETKASSIDQLLNKVSGVNMVSLGNEQHQMSIRQPITTKSLFLYLEDGIPVRTTGLFNHNALLEINMASVKNVEVIRGPSSSLYGSEAIGGVVNFITAAPSAVPILRTSIQGNNIGYKRTELFTSYSKNKIGFVLSGYYAQKKNGFLEFSDFSKATGSARIDYQLSERSILTAAITLLDYYSDMPGGIDSTMFSSRKFSNPQTFTYRSVNALRLRTTLTHSWMNGAKTTLSVVYRDNRIGQNPAYRIKDDYRRTPGGWAGKKNVAHGEINESSFNSYAIIAQHQINFRWKNARFLAGVQMDLSPSDYNARYIRISKDSVSGKYLGYSKTDSVLTNYSSGINNYAGFAAFEFNLLPKMRVVTSLRYDLFRYDFNNHLPRSAFSGSGDTVNQFNRVSPKIGFTYSLSKNMGLYANYSLGFVPPQVTEMYTGVKVPKLDAAVFYNYEVGGWASFLNNRLQVDFSGYNLSGTNEIISVRLDDGSSENRNAGKTSHQGIEFGIQGVPVKEISVRLSGAYSHHRFDQFIEKGVNYSGNEMNGAPAWIHNMEVWYKPNYIKGFRIGAEWQRIGSYYMDPANTASYKGYNILNLRAGYSFKGFELWLNVLNATDHYYAYLATKSSSYSYQLADPRNFNIGISYDFAKLIRK